MTGRVTDIAQHPSDANTIYVASSRGGVWKTSDGGVTWTPKSDHELSLAIGALAIAPSNPAVLYAGTGEGDIFFYRTKFAESSINASFNGVGILKTADGGNTWTLGGYITFLGACFYRIAVDPTNANIAYAASNLGLFRTRNGGTSWQQITSGLPAIGSTVLSCCDVVVDPTNRNVIYAAFWADGVYKTTNAATVTPTWTKLAGGFPTTDLTRISLAVAPTATSNVYALVASGSDGLKGFFRSADSGATWAKVTEADPVVSVYGAYTSNVAVDISQPSVVYLSGTSLYKATRTGTTWTVTKVGDNIHPDNHAFACHPSDHLTVYAGNDGGIYKSTDGGTTWDDRINEGLAITQFEFIDQHPTSDAYVIGGTQDNGTEIFRNHPVFYHSADGDGGAAGVDAENPRNVIHTYFSATPERSTQGGKFGSYASIATGLGGSSLFYPPFTYDATNSQNIAFGTSMVFLSSAQGVGGFTTSVSLPGTSGRVSALCYPRSDLIYAGTSNGRVYRLVRSGGSWTATAIDVAPLPDVWIWDIVEKPGDPSKIFVGLGGFGTGHVWRGEINAAGTAATWTDVSGSFPWRLPDAPVNSLAVDPNFPDHIYAGTDIGVFRTTGGGSQWDGFSGGLPNTAVYDLRLHAPTRLLRAATHGRGLWERRLDIATAPDVELYLRDHPMSTGRIVPAPAPVEATLEDPLQHVALGDELWWWMCADVKVDAPDGASHAYQLPVADVDYLAFETRLVHDNPRRGYTNRLYVQVHNRGIADAVGVTVKVLYADAGPGLPNLPSNFWSAFPGDGDTTVWKPIGTAHTIARLSPKRPEVVEFDWVPPYDTASHTCLLVVVDCASDPIPAASKVLNVPNLVRNERRVGLKNVHPVGVLPDPRWTDFRLYLRGRDELRFRGWPPGWQIGLLLPPKALERAEFVGGRRGKLTKAQRDALEQFLRRAPTADELRGFVSLGDGKEGATITGLSASKRGHRVLLMCQAGSGARGGKMTLVQYVGKALIGGNTFVLQRQKA